MSSPTVADILDGDPLADVRDLFKVNTVVRDGEVLPIDRLLTVPGPAKADTTP